MSRMPTSVTIADAPEAIQPLLRAVERQLGSVPNLFRITAKSPAALKGYLGVNAALQKGSLEPRTRERIALAVAETNGCGYCLAAHAYLGKTLAKLDDAEIEANRNGRSNDAKADAAVRFAGKVVEARGHIDSGALETVRATDYTDAQIVEIVAHVTLNTRTNHLNEVLGAEVDFSTLMPLAA